MKPIHEVTQEEVWRHWMRVELTTDPNFRSDLRDPLPADTKWYLAEVEAADIDSLYIISSTGQWTDISGGTFLVKEVAERLNLPSDHPYTIRIGDDIRRKLDYLNQGGPLDTRLIVVTESSDFSGRFTLIEGNKRAVAFLLRDQLVGCHFYVGVSHSMTEYHWARSTYQN